MIFILICLVIAILDLCYAQHSLKTYLWKSEIFISLYFNPCVFTVDRKTTAKQVKRPPLYMRWPHLKANQVQGLSLREIGGGFTKHHRAPSVQSACYAIAKPSTMVQKMQNIKKLRGHRVAVYCGITYSSAKFAINMVALWAYFYTSSSSVILINAIN